ncbi:MAG: hypothetical protein AB7U76_24460 [Pirellulales bacterium]
MVSVTITTGNGDWPVSVSDTALDAVLFDFNPSSSRDVGEIKALVAALISKMQVVQAKDDARPAQKRTAAIAITDLEKVQMVAVKALFAK